MTNSEAKGLLDAERQNREDRTLLVMWLVILMQARGIYYAVTIIATVVFPQYWMIWAGMLAFVWLVWRLDNDDGSDVMAAINRCRKRNV